MKKFFKFKRSSFTAVVATLALLVTLPLLLGSGCATTTTPAPLVVKEQRGLRVGFDIDDTLLFSTPAFEQGFKSGAEPYSPEFWEIVNSSDRKYSKVKQKTKEIVIKHQKDGDTIFVITARQPYGAEPLKDFIFDEFKIPKENIFFESEGKKQKMEELKLDVFYGDSDSDVTLAIEAGAKPYRILRAPESSYKQKYNPGKFGEEIIENSEW